MTSPLTTYAGSVPANYDKYLGPFLFEPYAIDLVQRMNADATEVLELACGTGRVTQHLSHTIHDDASIVATDLNEGMMAIAKERVKDKKIKWLVADAQYLPFEDSSFSAVVCQFGVMFFPDKLTAFKEAGRVLKTGGDFLFNT